MKRTFLTQRLKVRVLFIFSLLALVPNLSAQDSQWRVGGIVGAGQTWDDEGSLGPGVSAGGRIDWRLVGNTRVEAAIDLLTHDRSGEFFQANGDSVIVSASLLHGFGGGRVQPYVLGGASLVRHSGTTQFANLSFGRKSTDGGFHFGGGLSVVVGRRFELGPEARFYIIDAGNSSDPAWLYWLGGRFAIRF
jgi:hypothetical protein